MRHITFLTFIAFALAFVTEQTAAETTLPKWTKIILSDKFHAEGACIGDFNKDGVPDVAVGHFWYQGPDFKTRHQIFGGADAQDFNPAQYSECFGMFVDDFNGDGWDDILVCPHPGKESFWYENPKNTDGLWNKHPVSIELGNESQEFADILGIGRKSILFNRIGYLGFATPNPEKPYEPWEFIAVSGERNNRFVRYNHGLGYGDITGNGKLDFLERTGWWEQPDEPTQTPWKFHPVPFADAAAHLLVFDIDGDGLNDVVTSLDCHFYGLAWYKQVREDGKISFEKSVLIPRSNLPFNLDNADFPVVSQLHALVQADVNGDGIPDFITGKRFWAHGPTGDVRPNDPAVLMWWETKRDGRGGATFIPHIIDEDSGVGTQFAVGDLNGDGVLDIVIGNKKGAFIFLSVTE